MPSTRRKSPLSIGKKKSLSSTSVRSVMKQKKNKPGKSSTDSDGSYLQVGSDQATVSGVRRDLSQQASAAPDSVTNQAILTIEATNQDLSRRMENSKVIKIPHLWPLLDIGTLLTSIYPLRPLSV